MRLTTFRPTFPKTARWLFLVMAGFCVLGFSGPAEASLKFCNHTSYVLRTAAALPQPDGWRVEGWLTLRPGECRQVLKQLSAVPGFYIYAESHRAHKGPIRQWKGQRNFCVGSDDFQFSAPEGCTDAREFRPFFRVQIDAGATEWVHRFREPSSAPITQRQARTSGLQRLMTEAGYFGGRIDGYLGRRTRQAARKAGKDLEIKNATPESPELVDALLRVVDEKQKEDGIRFCNETPHKIWAAIAYQREEDWVSRGWWTVDAGTCVKVHKDGLPDRFIYAYGEATTSEGWSVQWQGAHPFCVSDVKFQIEGSEGCAARGYQKAQFIRIDTEDRAAWQFTFKEDDANPATETDAE